MEGVSFASLPLQPLSSLPMLQPLTPVQSIGDIAVSGAIQGAGATGFSQYLNEAINRLNALQVDAEHKTNLLLAGDIEDFHTPIIALEKASLGLGLATTLRNRVLEAYQEIMRMQI
ncbi:MAG: flagellar hook-basal body complex protein FliE [Peptococcaceae bacterium]|nr:flagellar hook-basal body complex protein FliE [Peptococcaceae bacterium]